MARAVRNVNPLTLGSGVKARELIPLPYWIVFPAMFVRGAFKHYIITTLFFVALYLRFNYTDNIFLAVGVVAGIWLFGVFIFWLFLGGDFKTPWRYFMLKTKWSHAATSVNLKAREGKTVPLLRRIRPVKGSGIQCDVLLAYAGKGMVDLHAEADDIAEIIGAYRATVSMVRPGRGRLTLYWTKEESFGTERLETTESQTEVIFGQATDGPAKLSLVTSLLIVGLSNSGKSNILRTVIHGIRRQGIVHRLHVIDPAGGVELSELENYKHTARYTDRAKDAEKLIQEAHKEMDSKLAEMRRMGIRKASQSDKFALDVIIIDELLLLSFMLKQGAESPLGEILTVGRKAKFVVLGLSQLAQVDTLGRIRDLFPQRVCLATNSSSMTDAALGDGAEKEGAHCSQIGSNTPGIGYYHLDSMAGYARFRAAEANEKILAPVDYVSSDDDDEELTGIKNRRCAVYKLYNVVYAPLYYGKAFDPEDRFKKHSVSKFWWVHVDHTKTAIEWYSNEELALAAEKQAIDKDQPIHNRQHIRVVR